MYKIYINLLKQKNYNTFMELAQNEIETSECDEAYEFVRAISNAGDKDIFNLIFGTSDKLTLLLKQVRFCSTARLSQVLYWVEENFLEKDTRR